MPTIEEGVLAAIKSGKAKMRPRWYFILRGALGITGAAILLIFIVYLASFIIFALHQSGAWFAPDFGFAGWYLFFISLPWMLILLSLLFVILLALLVKQYTFVYHRPLLYFLLAIIILVGAGSFLVAATAIHSNFMDYAIRNNVPFIGGFFQFETASPDAVHRGNIMEFVPLGFVIANVRGETSTVIFLGSSTFYRLGETVIVFGKRDKEGVIHPFGIEKIN